MSEIKNSGLELYGTEHFEQQQFGTAGIEGVKAELKAASLHIITTYFTFSTGLF